MTTRMIYVWPKIFSSWHQNDIRNYREKPKNHDFFDRSVIISRSSRWENSYPECFNRAKTWHVPLFNPTEAETSSLIANEFTDFLYETKMWPNFPLNVAALLFGFVPGGVLLDRVNPLLCKLYYVGRRGKPSTWLPRQKLAEERISRAYSASRYYICPGSQI